MTQLLRVSNMQETWAPYKLGMCHTVVSTFQNEAKNREVHGTREVNKLHWSGKVGICKIHKSASQELHSSKQLLGEESDTAERCLSEFLQVVQRSPQTLLS